jgi:hypothetical protein
MADTLVQGASWKSRLSVATLQELAMSKMLAMLAAIFVLWMIALPDPADTTQPLRRLKLGY